VDVAVTGSQFSASATPSLESVLKNAASQVTDPNTGQPLASLWTTPTSVLGSGSDYTSFLDHYGIASTDFSFSGSYGVYHSAYDSLYWTEHFGDPEFKYHVAAAQLWGLVALKLADSEVVPYNYTLYGQRLSDYYASIQRLLQQTNQTMDLSQLTASITSFQQAAKKLVLTADNNDRMTYTERQFLYAQGLPQRPYYRHLIQAPGLYSGYGADVYPGLTQAIRDLNLDQAAQQNQALYTVIGTAAAFLAGTK